MSSDNLVMGITLNEIPKATVAVTVNVRLGYMIRFRIWLALSLIRLAYWILNWQIEIKTLDDK